jgi:hypothetical protein
LGRDARPQVERLPTRLETTGTGEEDEDAALLVVKRDRLRQQELQFDLDPVIMSAFLKIFDDPDSEAEPRASSIKASTEDPSASSR